MPIPGTVLAPSGKRVLAWCVDLLAAVLLGGGFLAAGLWELVARPGSSPTTALLGGGALAVVLVLQVVGVARRGATLGKRLVGLRVVDAVTGRPIGAARAAARAGLQVLGLAAAVVGYVVLLLSPVLDGSGLRQGWLDRVARALVLDVALGHDPVTTPEGTVVSRRLDELLAARSEPPVTTGPVQRFGTWAEGAEPPEPSAAPVPAERRTTTPAEEPAPRRRDIFLPDSTTQPTRVPVPEPPPHVERPTVVASPTGPAVPVAPTVPVETAVPSAPAVPPEAGAGVIAEVPGMSARVPVAVGAGTTPTRGGAPEAPASRHVRRDDDDTPSPGRAEPAPDTGAVPSEPATSTPSDPTPPRATPRATPRAQRFQRAVRPSQPDLPDDVERTRLRPARGKVPELASAAPSVTLELTDGRRVHLTGTALVGRDPAPRSGEEVEELVAVPDPGRSVSKTHLAVGVDRTGAWVRDRGSTNGTVVTLADGQQILCGAGQQVRIPVGAWVAFGDYGFTVVAD